MIGRSTLRERRAQTSIDFVIAMGVFVIAVGSVMTLLPTIFDPFTASSSANMVVADRAASRLSADVLGSPATPGVLNATCAAEFFDGNAPDGCRYETTDLNRELGVADHARVNVTIENVTAGGDLEIHEVAVDGNPVQMAAGSTPSGTQDVTVAQRMVLLDGEQYRLYVRVW